MAIIYKFQKSKVAPVSSAAPPARPASSYRSVRYWLENYAHPELPDAHCVADFIDHEPLEALRSFQYELQDIARGNYNDSCMGGLLSARRRVAHGSFSNWAKVMLINASRRSA